MRVELLLSPPTGETLMEVYDFPKTQMEGMEAQTSRRELVLSRYLLSLGAGLLTGVCPPPSPAPSVKSEYPAVTRQRVRRGGMAQGKEEENSI